jgi:hypothetical protein
MEDAMLKKVAVYAMLASLAMPGLAMGGSPFAQAIEKSNDVPILPDIDARQAQTNEVTAFTYPASGPAEFGPRAILSRETLLTAIVTWLSTNFELPALHDHPGVEFVSTTKLTNMRYKGFLSEESREISSNEPTAQAVHQREVVAVYNDTTKTIFLAETWTGTTPAELSVLVHEMVHHLQNLGKLKYECPSAREKPAYLAQNQWLKQFGRDLENEFEIDMFTVVAASACMR